MTQDLSTPRGLDPRKIMPANTVTIEGQITALKGYARHVFDFSHDGRTCYCFLVSGNTAHLRVGQTVRMTGAWSTAVRNVFDALSVAPLRGD